MHLPPGRRPAVLIEVLRTRVCSPFIRIIGKDSETKSHIGLVRVLTTLTHSVYDFGEGEGEGRRAVGPRPSRTHGQAEIRKPVQDFTETPISSVIIGVL